MRFDFVLVAILQHRKSLVLLSSTYSNIINYASLNNGMVADSV